LHNRRETRAVKGVEGIGRQRRLEHKERGGALSPRTGYGRNIQRKIRGKRKRYGPQPIVRDLYNQMSGASRIVSGCPSIFGDREKSLHGVPLETSKRESGEETRGYVLQEKEGLLPKIKPRYLKGLGQVAPRSDLTGKKGAHVRRTDLMQNCTRESRTEEIKYNVN